MSSSSKLSTPVAIIIAGAVIAVAVIVSSRFEAPTPTGNQQANGAIATNPVGSANETLRDKLESVALAVGNIDMDEYWSCIENEDTAQKVDEDYDNAIATGGRGTPWSVVVTPSGDLIPINGAQPYEGVSALIQAINNGTYRDLAIDRPDELANVNPVGSVDHVRGADNAEITIIEYSDYDCPFCTRFHDTMKQIVQDYDNVAWVYRHFPLGQLHPDARTKSIAAECVADQAGSEAFWQVSDAFLSTR